MVVLLPDSLKEAANVKSERTTLGDSTHSVLHLIIHQSDGLHVLQLFNVNGLLSDSMSYRVRRSMKLHVKQEEKYEAVCESSCILVFVEPLCIHRFVCVSMWIFLFRMSVPESFNTVTFGGLTLPASIVLCIPKCMPFYAPEEVMHAFSHLCFKRIIITVNPE